VQHQKSLGLPADLHMFLCCGLLHWFLDVETRVHPRMTSRWLRRADFIPRLSAASVEGAFLEVAAASPVRMAAANFGRRVTTTLEGLKVT
jgi:hypothetical protein